MLGFSAIGETAIGELPRTAVQETIQHLQRAAALAQKDEIAAAAHIELALPYWEELISWSRKKGGAPRKAETADERRAAMYDQGMSMEEIARRTGGISESSVERSIRRGWKRLAERQNEPRPIRKQRRRKPLSR
jgi:hypothetical protein